MSAGLILAVEIGFGPPAVLTLTLTTAALTSVFLIAARRGWISVRATATSAAALLLTLTYGRWLLPLYAAVA